MGVLHDGHGVNEVDCLVRLDRGTEEIANVFTPRIGFPPQYSFDEFGTIPCCKVNAAGPDS